MTGYLLDANVLIDILQYKTDVRERLQSIDPTSRFVSSVVYFELWYGVSKSALPVRNTARLQSVMAGIQILPFDHADAQAAGDVRATLQRAKQPIGPYDTLIAGQALARGMVLVTANEREFRRVPGLLVENWAKPLA